jgi:hypothetical protein
MRLGPVKAPAWAVVLIQLVLTQVVLITLAHSSATPCRTCTRSLRLKLRLLRLSFD